MTFLFYFFYKAVQQLWNIRSRISYKYSFSFLFFSFKTENLFFSFKILDYMKFLCTILYFQYYINANIILVLHKTNWIIRLMCFMTNVKWRQWQIIVLYAPAQYWGTMSDWVRMYCYTWLGVYIVRNINYTRNNGTVILYD